MMTPEIGFQPENVRAMQAIYFASQLEDLKIFEVVDKLEALFSTGMLPLPGEKTAGLLQAYSKQPTRRMTELERRSLYRRAFGLPGGDPTEGSPNREFNDLWLRFISAVSSWDRQVRRESRAGGCLPVQANEEVKQTARDLAANLSLHGAGVTYFAAVELQKQVDAILMILSHPEIREAYGARDMWQVVDQVLSAKLSGAANNIRCRTLATTGVTIISWLAEHAQSLSCDSALELDSNLINACSEWLAAADISERIRQASRVSQH
jgi:hypothetical protein